MKTAERLRRIQAGAVVAFAVVLPIGKALSEIALWVGVLAWLLRYALRDRRSLLPPSPLNAWLLAWMVVALASFHNSIDVGASLHGLRKLLKAFGLYFLVVDTARDPRALRGVVTGCLVGLWLVVGDALWQAVAGRDLLYGRVPVYTLPSGVPVLRLSAMFDHAASLAIHLVSFCPLAIAHALNGGGRRRWLSWALVGLATVVVILNRNRGGIIGYVCALGLLACGMRRWSPAVLAVLTGVLQVATVPASVKAWSATMPTWLEKLTAPERLMYWQAALNMIKAHPVIGVGVNTFVKAYPAYRMAMDQYDQVGPYAHNQYLQLTAELGVLGLAVLLGVLVCVAVAVRRGLAGRRSTPFEAMVSAGAGAGLVGYAILGGLESSLFYGRGSLTFWLLVGLVMAAAPRVQRE